MVKVNFWPYKISNTRLLQATGQETMDITPQWRRLKWLGHVPCMEPTAHARTALSWTPEGRRKGGDQEQHGEEWYWTRSYSTRLRGLAGPCRGEVESGKVNTFNVLGGKPCLSFLCWCGKTLSSTMKSCDQAYMQKDAMNRFYIRSWCSLLCHFLSLGEHRASTMALN